MTPQEAEDCAPRHPAVKPCERLSERAEWRRARASGVFRPPRPGTGHAGWRADTVLETTPAPALRNQALMPVWLTPA